VDEKETLVEIMTALDEIAGRVPVVFPVHPRTAGRMAEFRVPPGRVRVIEPLGYVDMLGLLEGDGH
jgi:UDP-N-acetylglucosamine 2-epimerase (non-hydrolysing)